MQIQLQKCTGRIDMHEKQIKVSPYRYVNLVLFILAGFCNAVATQAFGAIGPLTRNLYQVSELEVNIVSMCYSIMYPLVIFPSNYIIETYGLKIGTLLGEMFLCLGLTIRLLINYHFYFFIIGTFVTGLGFCFMLCSPNKFVVSWFPVQQISLMNSLCIFSIFMSDSLGTFASAAFLDKNSTKQDFFNFFAFESGVIVIVLVLMAIFFKGSPDKPPNYASQVERADYAKSFKKLLQNQNYLILFGSMTFVFSALNIFFVCLSWILSVYNFESLQTGIIFITANLSGMAGCVVTGLLFSNRSYRRNCILYTYACVVAFLTILLGLEIGQEWLLYVGGGLFGFHIFPYLTSMTDFASETAFPVGEAISGGSLLFGGQILGVASSLLMSLYIFDGESLLKTRLGAVFIFIILILGAVCLHSSRPLLRRSDYESEKRDKFVHLLTEDGDQ